MRPRVHWPGLVFLAAFAAQAETQQPASVSAATEPELVYVIPIRSDVNTPMVYVMRRGVKEAERAGAGAIVLDMHTNGGEGDAMEEIMEVLEKFRGDTCTFVNTKAFSAGAFIAVATKRIYMAPGSVIGAATPMMLMPTGDMPAIPEAYQKKFTSAYAAKIRAAAQRNGYNAAVVDKMVDASSDLVIDGKTLKPKGEILTLTNVEAEEKYGKPPKPLLSSGTMKNLEELLDRAGHKGAALKRIEPTGAETIADWINTVAPLLLALGALGIYLEFKLQSFGLIGIAAVGCLLLYFFGQYIAGMSGYEYALLFIIGVALLVVEMFVLPGHFISGLLGTMCILVALLMAMVDHYPGGPLVPSFPDLRVPLRNLGLAIVLAVLFILVAAKFLPRTSMWDQLALKAASTGEIKTPEPGARPEDLLGQEGMTVSQLRPAGKAKIGERLADVVTEGDLIPKDARVKVVKVEGTRVVVAKV
ncbi:MAG: hypothetical protein FJ388_11915 [Verrucomicrobia bacterium]|nr:hypothetical protein [Verrucomicrobiota bacterium]